MPLTLQSNAAVMFDYSSSTVRLFTGNVTFHSSFSGLASGLEIQLTTRSDGPCMVVLLEYNYMA